MRLMVIYNQIMFLPLLLIKINYFIKNHRPNLFNILGLLQNKIIKFYFKELS